MITGKALGLIPGYGEPSRDWLNQSAEGAEHAQRWHAAPPLLMGRTAAGYFLSLGGLRCLLGVRYLTASSGTYTPTAGTTNIFVELWGGGGGGGAARVSNDATQAAAGGGGAGGTYTAKYYSTVSASYSYVVGAGGAGGAGASAGSGSIGGDTSFNGGIVTAPGGPGGTGGDETVNYPLSGGAQGNAGTGGDVTVPGSPGGMAVLNEFYLGTPTRASGFGGFGGASSLGGGGRATPSGAPAGSTAYGGGGAGAAEVGLGLGVAHATSGGAGKQGIIRVWEFG